MMRPPQSHRLLIPRLVLPSMTSMWSDNLNYLCRWGRSILRNFQFKVIGCGSSDLPAMCTSDQPISQLHLADLSFARTAQTNEANPACVFISQSVYRGSVGSDSLPRRSVIPLLCYAIFYSPCVWLHHVLPPVCWLYVCCREPLLTHLWNVWTSDAGEHRTPCLSGECVIISSLSASCCWTTSAFGSQQHITEGPNTEPGTLHCWIHICCGRETRADQSRAPTPIRCWFSK